MVRFLLLLCSFLLLVSVTASAQSNELPSSTEASLVRITGSLVDGNGVPVEFANVLLMQAADSVLAKAEMADLDGNFSIAADSGTYFLQVVMMGYDDYQGETFTLSTDKDFGSLQLQAFAKTLETAVVTAKKPFLEQQAGKMIVNVEGSVTGQTGSATQLLQKVPGVVVRQGNVSLAGSPGVTILIDGKPTRYMDVNALLRDLPASDIAKIEVITQPGASYDAEGGGVLNIVLKKNVRLGTNGSVRLGAGRGTYDKLNTSVQLSHRDGPLNTYGTASYRRGSGFDQLLLDREVLGARVVQDNFEPFLPNTMSVRGGIDYDFTERTSLGVSGRYSNTIDNATGLNTSFGYFDAPSIDEEIPAGLVPDYSLRTRNLNNQTRNSYGADAFYRFDIDTLGRKLTADVSYGAFRRDGTASTLTEVVAGNFGSDISDIRSDELGATNVVAGQVDYVHPMQKGLFGLATQTTTFRMGTKYSHADVDADLAAERRPMNSEQPFVNAPGLTNRFLYNEDIAAGYVSADVKLGEVSLNAGLRYEHTFINGENVTSDSSFQRNYGGVFPSFGVSFPIKGDIGGSAAYSYRLDRPNYGQLNPFVRYMDPLTIQRGNTLLQPEYIHNAQMSLTYEGQPFFRLAYSRTEDAISLVTEQNSTTGITEGYNANLDTYTRYGGHLFAPLSFIPKVDGYFGGMLYYQDFESQFLGSAFSGSGWEFTGFANATVELPLKLKAELNYWIQSGGQQGIIKSGTVYGSSIGLERKFLDDQLTVGISYEDGLFEPWDGQIRYQDQQMNIINTWETDIVMVNFTYKFGNRYVKGKERRNSAAQDVLNRAE